MEIKDVVGVKFGIENEVHMEEKGGEKGGDDIYRISLEIVLSPASGPMKAHEGKQPRSTGPRPTQGNLDPLTPSAFVIIPRRVLGSSAPRAKKKA
jgi:hypothetical protein